MRNGLGFRLFHERFDRLVEFPGAVRVEVLETDDAPMIEHDERRIARDVPPAGDWSEAVFPVAVPPTAPGDIALDLESLEDVAMVVVVDPQDGEWPAAVPVNDRAQTRVDQAAAAAVLVAGE